MSSPSRTDRLRILFPQIFYRSPQPLSLSEFDSGSYVEVNDAWLALTGYARDEVIGNSRSELNLWVDAGGRARILESLAAGEAVRDVPLQCRKKSGDLAEILFSADLIESEGVQCLLAALQDITELKRAGRLLRQSEERFAAIFENNPMAMTVARHADGVYLQVNRAYEKLLGYRREEVLGKSTLDLGVWADPRSRARMVARLERDGGSTSIEAGVRRRDGGVFEAIFTAARMELDGVAVIHGTVQDISELRRISRQKDETEARFEKIVESSPQPMSITRLSDGLYLGVNRAMERILGYSRAEMIGRSSIELGVWVDPAVRGELQRQIAAGQDVATIEAQVRKKNGSLVDVQFSGTVIELDGAQVLHGTVVDLTAMKQAARQQVASEERAAQLFRASPDAIVITRKADGVYLEMNDAWTEQFGYARNEMIGRGAVELGVWVDPAERQRFLTAIGHRGGTRGFETRLRRSSGEVADVLLSAESIQVDGEDGLIICTTDITVRKQAERLRVASEERFRKIYDTSPDAISIVRIADGVHLEVNHTWLDLYGLTRPEVIGRSSYDFNVWQQPEDREQMIGEMRSRGSIRGFEVHQRHRSGAVIDVLISAQPIEWNGEAALISCGIDVTVIRRAERERAASEARFAQVFQASPNAIVFSRASDGSGIRVNDAWHQLFGYTAEDIRDQTSTVLNMWVDPEFRGKRQKVLAEGGTVRDVETKMRAKSGGILDILISSQNVELDGVPHIVSILTDISARKSADRQIEYLATRDYLTGLPNRVLFTDRLGQGLAKAARDGTRLALMFLDLDHFKNINDSLGHQAGDHVLTEVAARLSATLRGADSIGRQGGDEFLLLLDGLTAATDAGPLAEKVVAALSQPVLYNGQSLKVSCSVGISIYPDDANNEADLMRNADLAMYAAKEAGRNAFRFYTAGMNQRLVERMSVEQQLRGALGRDEFVLHFQPKVAFESGLVSGCEALLRWRRDGKQLLYPARFMDVAEESRLIAPIGLWVLREVCRSLRRWLDAGLEVVPVACNVSVHQFNAKLPPQIAEILLETGVPAHLLQLEITETVMMHHAETHLETMRQLKQIGLKIALDDFGTGFSSLSYLRHMALDVLKIDRSFVRDVAANSDAQAIVAAIIAMAGKFGMKTVAEGVETSAQAEALRRMRCDEYQGFMFSAALPADEFEATYLLAA